MLEVAGVALLPDWPLFLSFALAGFALNIVPGSDMAFVISAAARGGRRDGIVASLGVGAGTLVHVMAAAVGLSAVLAASQTAFDLIKWAGAAYLLWVAVSLLRSPAQGEADGGQPIRAPGARLFQAAALVNILNPKVALFFLAFLPQFVDPDSAMPSVQILFLGLWFGFSGTIVNTAIAVAAAGTAARLKDVRWTATAARYFAATAMGALAVKLALSEARQA